MNFPGIVTDVTQEYCEEIRNGLFQKKSTPPTTEGMLENLTGGGVNGSGNPDGRGALNLKIHPRG